MEYAEFIRSALCKPLVLAEEDQPQDALEWKRMLESDRRRQYAEYVGLNGEPAEKPVSDEETRVLERLATLTKKNLGSGVESGHAGEEKIRAAVQSRTPDRFEAQSKSEVSVSPTQKLSRQEKWRRRNKPSIAAYMRDWRSRQKSARTSP